MYKWKNETCETIPGMRGGEIKENDVCVGGVMISTMLYSKNFYKCYNVPPAQQ
jgi:hypothetical protein